MKIKYLKFFIIFLFFLTYLLTGVAVYADSSSTFDIPTNSVSDLFGGDIKLAIFKTNKFQGEAGFWSIFTSVIAILFPISFLVSIAAVIIGFAKMSMSGGESGKMESGKKWFVNGVLGFVSTGVFLLVANIILVAMGFGGFFEVSQFLATCNKVPLYTYRKDNAVLDTAVCVCQSNNWSCTNP